MKNSESESVFDNESSPICISVVKKINIIDKFVNL